MKSFHKISVICPTLNNEADIEYFLKSIKKQKYPKNKVEIIIVDGGSIDKTLQIANKYGVKVIVNKEIFADIGVNLGIKQAKGDLLMILATDNIFKDSNAFVNMATVFANKEIVAAFPKQDSDKSDTFISKYINTFTDPFNHFIYGYAANPRTFKKMYKTLISNNVFDVYDLKSNPDKPLISFAQGFTIKKGIERSKKNAFDDLAPVIELVNDDKKLAYVHSVTLYHHTIRNTKHFIEKQSWRTKNAVIGKNFGIRHRISYLSEDQKRRIRLWPVYSLTILPPVINALIGLVKDREPMWIFHPLLCIISAYTSAFTVLEISLTGKIKK